MYASVRGHTQNPCIQHNENEITQNNNQTIFLKGVEMKKKICVWKSQYRI